MESERDIQELVDVKRADLEVRLGLRPLPEVAEGEEVDQLLVDSVSVKELASLHKLETQLKRRQEFELVRDLTRPAPEAA